MVLCKAEVSRRDVLPGEEIRYALSVENAGAAAATSVALRDELSIGLELFRVSATQGIAEVQGQSVTMRLGIIEPGQTAMALLDVRVPASAAAGQVYVQQPIVFFDGGQVPCNVIAVGSPPDRLPATGANGRRQ